MYKFYLDKVLLPVTPSSVTIKISNKNKTYTLLNDGEINVLKDAGLTDIEFDCLLPNVKYPFSQYTNGFKKADYFLEKIEKFKLNKKSFKFKILRQNSRGNLLFNTNFSVSLEDYNIKEDVKNYGTDVYVSIKLKQYKPFGTQKAVIVSKDKKTATTEKTRETKKTDTAKNYTVVKGDCLWNIAKKFYGDGSKWKQIYETNKSIIGSNPNLIYPGQKYTIPAIKG